MKYLFLLILVSYAALAGFTQEISGTISNMQNRQLVFVSNDTYLKAKYDTVYPDEKGNFSIRFNLSNPGYLTIWNINFQGTDLYVKPGSILKIEADGTDNTTFLATRKYSGKESDINNFIAKTTHPDRYKSYFISTDIYKYGPQKFVTYINDFYAKRDSIKNVWRAGLSSGRLNAVRDFLLTDSINTEYDKAGYWFSYIAVSVEKNNREEFFNKVIKRYVNQSEDPRFLASPDYRWFWNRYIRYRSPNSNRGSTWMKFWIDLPNVLEGNLSGKIKQVASSTFEADLIENQLPGLPDSLITAFNETSKYLLKTIGNTAAINDYQRSIDRVIAYRKISRKGQPAPDFSLVDTLGRKYSLADFKGKIIYLDVWASWCGPCIAQFPAARKLSEKYKSNEKLVFLTISMDNKKKDWLEKGLKIHKPEGLQLWAEGGFAGTFATNYGINSIPKYVVIDKEGKIVNFRAPRPEDEPAISNLLNEAIAR